MRIGLHDIDRGEVSLEPEPLGPPAPPERPVFTPIAPMPAAPPPSTPVLVAKFLLHGLALNALMFVVVFLWVFLAIGLEICGYILGLLIAIAVLMIVYGYVNAWVTGVMWFEVDTGFFACFFHGLFLFVASLVPSAIILLAGNLDPWNTVPQAEYHYLFLSSPLPDPPALVIALLVDLGLTGYLGRAVASIWRRQTPDLPPDESEDL